MPILVFSALTPNNYFPSILVYFKMRGFCTLIGISRETTVYLTSPAVNLEAFLTLFSYFRFMSPQYSGNYAYYSQVKHYQILNMHLTSMTIVAIIILY